MQLDLFPGRRTRPRSMGARMNAISATTRLGRLIGSTNTCNRLRMTSLSFAAPTVARNSSLYLDWFSILRASLVGWRDSVMWRATLILLRRSFRGCSSFRFGGEIHVCMMMIPVFFLEKAFVLSAHVDCIIRKAWSRAPHKRRRPIVNFNF